MTQTRCWRWRNVPVPRVHVVALAIGVLLHRVVPWPVSRRHRSSRGFGSCLVALGAYGVGLSVRAVGGADVTSPSELVTSGVYGVTRNPMYVAWTTIYVGLAFVANTAWLVVLSPLVLVVTHRTVRREERELERAFGDEYRTYAASVPRYVRFLTI